MSRSTCKFVSHRDLMKYKCRPENSVMTIRQNLLLRAYPGNGLFGYPSMNSDKRTTKHDGSVRHIVALAIFAFPSARDTAFRAEDICCTLDISHRCGPSYIPRGHRPNFLNRGLYLLPSGRWASTVRDSVIASINTLRCSFDSPLSERSCRHSTCRCTFHAVPSLDICEGMLRPPLSAIAQ